MMHPALQWGLHIGRYLLTLQISSFPTFPVKSTDYLVIMASWVLQKQVVRRHLGTRCLLGLHTRGRKQEAGLSRWRGGTLSWIPQSQYWTSRVTIPSEFPFTGQKCLGLDHLPLSVAGYKKGMTLSKEAPCSRGRQPSAVVACWPRPPPLAASPATRGVLGGASPCHSLHKVERHLSLCPRRRHED